MLWQPDYDTPLAWQAVQQAAPGRVSIVSRDALPGRYSRWKPTGNAMRARAVPGELTAGRSRSEVYGRAAYPFSNTPPEQWPDPPGAERWYGWSLLVPDGFTFTSEPPLWLVSTQWPGRSAQASPPVSVEIKRRNLRLGGARTNAGLIPADGDLGPVTPGSWTRLAVGMLLSPDPAVGWVEVWRDGVQAIPRIPVATMDLAGGQPDPTYLKQGVYRDAAWAVTHDLYFGPITVGLSLADVA